MLELLFVPNLSLEPIFWVILCDNDMLSFLLRSQDLILLFAVNQTIGCILMFPWASVDNFLKDLTQELLSFWTLGKVGWHPSGSANHLHIVRVLSCDQRRYLNNFLLTMPPSFPARAARPWLPTPQLPSTFKCSRWGQAPGVKISRFLIKLLDNFVSYFNLVLIFYNMFLLHYFF